MDKRNGHLRNEVTVVIPRDLWIRLKFEVLRRQTTLKLLLAEALHQTLERWRKESEHERASD